MSKLKEAAAIEDAIDDLSQPPYPVIPANELCGNLLLELNRPNEAVTHFQKTLMRTPGRPKAILGLARAAEALGDGETAPRDTENSCQYGKWLTQGFLSLSGLRRFSLRNKSKPTSRVGV